MRNMTASFIMNIALAYKLYVEHVRINMEASTLSILLNKYGLILDASDPTRNLCDALALADAYNMIITRFTPNECAALIPQSYWVREMRDTQKSKVLIECTDQNGDNMLSVGGTGYSVQFAVCRCLLNAYVAGVVDIAWQ